jgi:hypothetical protein
LFARELRKGVGEIVSGYGLSISCEPEDNDAKPGANAGRKTPPAAGDKAVHAS